MRWIQPLQNLWHSLFIERIVKELDQVSLALSGTPVDVCQVRVDLTFNHVRSKSQESLGQEKVEDCTILRRHRQVVTGKILLQADQPLKLDKQVIITAESVGPCIPQVCQQDQGTRLQLPTVKP